jgi:glycosyltransferase involved in cell wall biosynthesis
MSPPKPTPILFTHYGDEWFRGSEQLLSDLLANLDRTRFEPILWCNGSAMAEAARALGIPTYRTRFEFYFDYDSPRFNLSHYRSLVREGIALVRQHDIQVLHASSAAPNQWLLPVARATKRPLLAHLHIDYRARSRYVCLLHQATLIVGVSRQVTQDFLHDGTPAVRTHTIYNGIDFARLRGRGDANPRCELGISPEALVIATVGSLIRRKGQDVLIRAFAIAASGRDIHLLVAGEGPDRAAYEALADELGLRGRVHFLGYRGDTQALYRAADIIALASRADAFGLVLAEAGHFSLPAVATTVGGIPEVVEDKVTGLLVPPDDPVSFAQALVRLIDDPAQRLVLGAAAKERVERLFSVRQMVTNFHDAYARLAQLPSRGLGWLGAGLSIAPYANAIARRCT